MYILKANLQIEGTLVPVWISEKDIEKVESKVKRLQVSPVWYDWHTAVLEDGSHVYFQWLRSDLRDCEQLNERDSVLRNQEVLEIIM